MKRLASYGVIATSTLGSANDAVACHEDPEPRGYDNATVLGLSLGLAFGAGSFRFSYGLDLRFTSEANALVLRFEGRGLTSARAVIAGHRLLFDGTDDPSAAAEVGLALHSSHKESEIGRVLALHVAGGPYASTLAALHAQASIPFFGDLRNYDGSVSAVLLPTEWKLPCSGGRRLRDDDTAVLPGVATLGECRDAVAVAWIEDARAEYASIWAFERMAAELRVARAPEALIHAARRAAADEARHVALCSRLAGTPFHLLPLEEKYAAPRWAHRSTEVLTTLAREAWIDGCLGEGVAAAQAASAALSARHFASEAQHTIAEDERRHAELAWAILEWAWREGDTRVRDVIIASTRSEPELPAMGPELGDREQLIAGGRLTPAEGRAAAEHEIGEALVRVRDLTS
ncbi:MAG: hypothetical protein M4D80_27700 [Myxococcota bacterium]|nr:hypothetical protein [Myxococcota bacterium]